MRIILIISVFTTFLIAEKWEYLIGQKNTKTPYKDNMQPMGFMVGDENSKYNNLYDINDLVKSTDGKFVSYKLPNGLTWNQLLINSLNKMGNDGWEIIDIQENTYHFKRKVLEPIKKK